MSARTFSACTPGSYGNVAVIETNGGYAVQLHRTVVAQLDRGTITLKTGGWHTRTTAVAINNALKQWGCPGGVYQVQGILKYSDRVGGEPHPFREGMEVDARNGKVVGLPVKERA